MSMPTHTSSGCEHGTLTLLELARRVSSQIALRNADGNEGMKNAGLSGHRRKRKNQVTWSVVYFHTPIGPYLFPQMLLIFNGRKRRLLLPTSSHGTPFSNLPQKHQQNDVVQVTPVMSPSPCKLGIRTVTVTYGLRLRVYGYPYLYRILIFE